MKPALPVTRIFMCGTDLAWVYRMLLEQIAVR
jgi:hypothetical protein